MRKISFFKKIRYFCEYIFVIFAYCLIRTLPLGFSRLFSSVCGLVIYLIPSYKRLCITNIKIAFPEKSDCEVRKIAKESLKNMCLTIFEFLWFSGREEVLMKYIDGAEEPVKLTQNAMKEGGIMWISPHLGNWELAALAISKASNLPMAVVMRPVKNPFINNLIVRSRSRSGNRVIYTQGALRALVKARKEGCFLATLIDQNTRIRDGGAFLNFFGLPAATSLGPAYLAKKLNILPVVGGCLRIKNRYQSFMQTLPRNPSEYSSHEELVQDILNITEKFIREHPEQYLWFYKRWQYIPLEASDEVAKKFPYYAKKPRQSFYTASLQSK